MDAEFKYSIDTMNQVGTSFQTMEKIIKEWSKDQLIQAIDEGYVDGFQRMVIDLENDECLDVSEITIADFFSSYDLTKRHQTLLKNGIVLHLVKQYAKIKIDWSRYILVHEDGMKVPKEKDEFTYSDVEAIYEEGLFFVDLQKGKVDPFSLFDFSNPLWAALSMEDASKLIHKDKNDIEMNIKAGKYGLCRELSNTWIINLGKFAEYHHLV